MVDAQSADKLSIEGALTIRTAATVVQELQARLQQHRVIEIDLSRATELDISGIQVILSARATAVAGDKTLSVAQPLAPAAHAALLQGGFLHVAGETDSRHSFWLGGDA